MKRSSEAAMVWGTILLSAALWVGVVYFAFYIRAEHSEGISEMTEIESAAARQQAFIRLHVLARETKNAREELEGLIDADLLDIADSIEGAGDISGVPVKIRSAVPVPERPRDANTARINEADLIVEAEGSFRALMHTVALFEALPIVSRIQGLELERDNVSSEVKGGKSRWRLVAHMRVLTTGDI